VAGDALEPIMHLCVRICVVLAVGVVTASDPVIRELRALHGRLKDEPNNLPLALRLARGYLELGRVTGDPRYAGYAQAALTPWPGNGNASMWASCQTLSSTSRQALSCIILVIEDDPETAELLVDSLATCNASMSGVGSIRRTARRSSASLPRTHGVVSLAGSSI
jgi:hypothetical protein